MPISFRASPSGGYKASALEACYWDAWDSLAFTPSTTVVFQIDCISSLNKDITVHLPSRVACLAGGLVRRRKIR